MINFKMEENGFTMQAEFGELPISPNDKDGFRPYQLLVASLAGCSSTLLRQILTKMRIDFQDISVSSRVDRSDGEVSRIEKVYLHFMITGENLRLEKIEKAVNVARNNCGMIQSVIGSIDVEESVEIVQN